MDNIYELLRNIGTTKDDYQQPLDGHGLSYRAELIAEYRTLASKADNPRAEEFIQELLKKTQMTWDDLMGLELAVVKVLPLEKLRRKAWSIREEYREIAGEAEWTAYQSSAPELKTPVEADLRADTEQLMIELQWLYTTLPLQEKFRSKVLSDILKMFVLLLAVAVLLMALYQMTYFTAAFMAGAAGAFFSAFQRLQKTPLGGNEEVNLAKTRNLTVSAQLAPLIGGIAAVVLSLLFMAGLVTGTMFPNIAGEFSSSKPKPSTVTSNATNQVLVAADTNVLTVKTNTATSTNIAAKGPVDAKPKESPIKGQEQQTHCPMLSDLMICVAGGRDLALWLVWAFIAGFAERLVPDILNRLTDKSQQKEK
jgi:hypothetical protein